MRSIAPNSELLRAVLSKISKNIEKCLKTASEVGHETSDSTDVRKLSLVATSKLSHSETIFSFFMYVNLTFPQNFALPKIFDSSYVVRSKEPNFIRQIAPNKSKRFYFKRSSYSADIRFKRFFFNQPKNQYFGFGTFVGTKSQILKIFLNFSKICLMFIVSNFSKCFHFCKIVFSAVRCYPRSYAWRFLKFFQNHFTFSFTKCFQNFSSNFMRFRLSFLFHSSKIIPRKAGEFIRCLTFFRNSAGLAYKWLQISLRFV